MLVENKSSPRVTVNFNVVIEHKLAVTDVIVLFLLPKFVSGRVKFRDYMDTKSVLITSNETFRSGEVDFSNQRFRASLEKLVLSGHVIRMSDVSGAFYRISLKGETLRGMLFANDPSDNYGETQAINDQGQHQEEEIQ